MDPAEGSLGVPTPTTIRTDSYMFIPDVWFGEQRSNEVTLGGGTHPTAPPSSTPGAVNVKIVHPNGILNYMPQGFTYGVEVVPAGILAASPTGGATVELYGYGVGVDIQGSPITVTIGGQVALVTGRSIYAAESNRFGYPFPMQHLKVTARAGSPGVKSVAITSSAGSVTLPQGFRHLKSVTSYSLSSPPKRFLYDPTRNWLYVTLATQVEVFSLASKTFLPPIIPPTLAGSRDLRGMALTPDGSRLLVANYADDSVAVIDPDNPGGAVAVAATPVRIGSQPECNPGPQGIAPTDTGKAFISGVDLAAYGCSMQGLLELDLNSLSVTPRLEQPLTSLITSSVFLSGSRNGQLVFAVDPSHDGGDVYMWNSASNVWVNRRVSGQPMDAATSGDGKAVEVTTFFNGLTNQHRILDPDLNLVARLVQPDFLYFGADERRPGNKLHDSGALLYRPFQFGVDIFDVHRGEFRQRISLTQQIPWDVEVMAIDDTGGRIFLVTNAGLTIVELDAVPLSIGGLTPSAGPAGVGTEVTIRGSGFRPDTVVKFGTEEAFTTFVDANTLRVVTPSLPAGSVRVTITNPDGEEYYLDAAFLFLP